MNTQRTADLVNQLMARPQLPARAGRIPAVDLARGIAVALMILSHGVIGLLEFDDLTAWGQIPVQLITKFASSTFIMVFGIALAVAFMPRVGTADWPRLRLKLWINALIVFFWYKVLTVAEMLYLSQPSDIVDTLLYRNFPSFVEILGFYAIALLWVPLLLPLWVRLPLIVRLLSPVALAGLHIWAAASWSFGDNQQLRAIFVEDPDYYTWGQFARGPLILLGLLIGEALLHHRETLIRRWRLAAGLLVMSALLFIAFVVQAGSDLASDIEAVARNQGKHPPELFFMLFSMGGAFLILGLSIGGGKLLSKVLLPFTIIGSNALQAFIFHIVVIFVGFRYLLGYWQDVEYEFALMLTLGLIVATAIWIRLVGWIQQHR